MTEQAPIYFIVLVYFMEFLTVATIAALAAVFVTLLVGKWKNHKQGGDEEGGGWGGSGGWTDKPGPPPGGGGGGGNDHDLHTQFHAVADAVGRLIKSEEKEKEKVLK
jgi:hypothetical protein